MAPRVLVLDDSEDLVSLMTVMCRVSLGEACLGLRSVAALMAQAREALATRIAFLDVNLGAGQPSGIDAFRWLREQGYAGRIYFLTGHAASYPVVMEAARTGIRVLTKPVKAAELVSLASEALGGGRP